MTLDALPLSIIVGAAVALVTFALLSMLARLLAPLGSETVKSEVRRLGEFWGDNSWRPLLPFIVAIRPQFEPYEQRPSGQSIKARLAMLGNPLHLRAADFMAICLISSIALTAIGVGAGLLMPLLGLSVTAFIPLGLIGLMFGISIPLYYLYSESSIRVTRIERDLPYALDLTVLMIDAGASLNEAIRNLGTNNKYGPLGEELAIVDRETTLGTIFNDAMGNFAQRIQSDDLTIVVQAMEQGQALGTPIADILREQADILRLKRSQRAEKIAKTAGSKMVLPLIMIMAATFLLVLGPAALRFSELLM